MDQPDETTWAQNERDILLTSDPYRFQVEPASDPELLAQRKLRAERLEQQIRQKTASTIISRPKTAQTSVDDRMQDVTLQFMNLSGALKSGGTSSVIPKPSYYRVRSGRSSAYSSMSRPESGWKYFNSELSEHIQHISSPLPVPKPPSLPKPSRNKDLHNQKSLSNRLLNVTTIDDYQERYDGKRVKSASRYGHRISRASSASTRTSIRPHSTDSRISCRQKRPTSSKAESGIYDVHSVSDFEEPTGYSTLVNMPLEYYAMLERSAESPCEVVSRGFRILMNANECVKNTSKKLYREDERALEVGNGSEFFKRLKATLRYQLLVGEDLPSKSRYRKALSMHCSNSRPESSNNENASENG